MCRFYYTMVSSPQGSAERERERLDPRVQELDLELPIDDRPGLTDQLVHPLRGNRTIPLLVDVESVRRVRRPAVDAHAKPHRRSSPGWPHHHVQIASPEAIHNPPTRTVRHHGRIPHRPVARQAPRVEP